MRRGLTIGLAGAGVASALAAGVTYAKAQQAYVDFLAMPEREEAMAYFDNEVQPRKTMAAVEGVGALVLLGGAGAIWMLGDVSVTVGPQSLMLEGRW